MNKLTIPEGKRILPESIEMFNLFSGNQYIQDWEVDVYDGVILVRNHNKYTDVSTTIYFKKYVLDIYVKRINTGFITKLYTCFEPSKYDDNLQSYLQNILKVLSV